MRGIDGRATWAAVLALIGAVWNIDSLAVEEATDEAPSSCSYFDIADMALGPVAVLLALAAVGLMLKGKRRLSTAAVALAGLVGGVLVTLHGFGELASECDADPSDPTLLVVLILLAVAVVVVMLDPTTPTGAGQDQFRSEAPEFPEGVRRCRNCGFSSNGGELTACRNCGSSDLEDATLGRPPISKL